MCMSLKCDVLCRNVDKTYANTLNVQSQVSWKTPVLGMYFHYVMKNVIVHLWRLNPLWVCSRHRICSYISASGKAPFHQHEEKLYTGTEFNAKQSFVFFCFFTLWWILCRRITVRHTDKTWMGWCREAGGELFPGFCSSLTDTIHVCSYINRLVHGDTLEAETLKQSNWLSEASAIGVQAKQPRWLKVPPPPFL